MQKNQDPKSKVIPLVISLILLLGLGFAGYVLYLDRVELLSKQLEVLAVQKAEKPNSSVDIQTEITQLEALLTADPCTLKLMFAKGAIATDGLVGLEKNRDISSLKANPILQTATAMQPQAAQSAQAMQSQAAQSAQAMQSQAAQSTQANLELAAPKQPLSAEGALNVKMEQATVFILSVIGDDIYTGTGFFISPTLILTNRHVILGEGQLKAEPAVVVTNKHLKTLQSAKIVAISADERRDYALLQLEQPALVQPLALRPKVERTTKVSAWGFPSTITANDPNYHSLLSGNLAASPEVVYSDGVVSVVVDEKPQLILHTAPLSHGNSGGPLVDSAGNVLGINTLITLDDQTYRQTSLALAIADVLVFLQEHGVTPNIIKD